MKIQAREIVRFVKRVGYTLDHGSVGWNHKHCARSAVMHMFNGDKSTGGWWLYNDPVAQKKTGLTVAQLDSLEAGFEGGDFEEGMSKMYFKMGQRVAKLANL